MYLQSYACDSIESQQNNLLTEWYTKIMQVELYNSL